MTSLDADSISMPAKVLWALRLGCGGVGFGVGFAVPPLAAWIDALISDVPGPLAIAAQIPTIWLVPILTVVGLAAGFWLAEAAEHECLHITVDSEGMLTSIDGREHYVQRQAVSNVFTDPKDLVLIDSQQGELFRGSVSDISVDALRTAFTRHGYPWSGTADPYEAKFQRWIDGHPDLDSDEHKLLRDRRKALNDDAAEEATELATQLQKHGIVVRDKEKKQQYRRLASQ